MRLTTVLYEYAIFLSSKVIGVGNRFFIFHYVKIQCRDENYYLAALISPGLVHSDAIEEPLCRRPA